jgi:hypothetical protein
MKKKIATIEVYTIRGLSNSLPSFDHILNIENSNQSREDIRIMMSPSRLLGFFGWVLKFQYSAAKYKHTSIVQIIKHRIARA